jgi:murein L,D-transpeptidase YcbB/YkuD
MLKLRLDGILAGSALALVLASSAVAGPDGTAANATASIDSRIPVPQPAEVKPPTQADLGVVAAPDAPPALDAAAGERTADAPAASTEGVAFPATDPAQTATDGAMPTASTDEEAAPSGESKPDPMATGAVTPAAAPGTEPPATPAAAETAGDKPPAAAAAAPPKAAPAPVTIDRTGLDVPTASLKQGTTPAPDRGVNDPARDAVGIAPGDLPPDTAGPSPKAAPSPAAKEAPKDTAKPIAAGLAAEDVPVAEKLRDLLGGKIERMFEHKNERTAVAAFYSGRGFAPLWIEGGAPGDRGRAVIARLRAADDDGLDPADYPVPDFNAAAGRPAALADAELRLTSAVLAYARHAQIGRVHFSRISPDIFYNLAAPDPADVLNRLAKATDPSDALGSYNPPQLGFKALRDKLAEARGHNSETGPARIASGPTLRVGMHDERVPQLRERLGLDAASDASDTTYDRPLADAVKKFQRDHDLSPNGNLNASTLEALNGPRREHLADTLIANMERWRWLPRDLGKVHVMVNIPDFTLKVVQNGHTIWRTRIVTGKPSTPTPLLSEQMRYITVNPTWNVPPSIVNKEYLPVLQQDPNALTRIGLQVEYNQDGSIRIFQPPGAGNALGRIRFNFPNKFLVYQHDTPDKYLFARDKRAYSHGCMRVQDPLKYAEVLLGIGAPNENYTVERLQRMFGGEEHDINLTPNIPVHVTYQTAFVDDAGKLELRDDVYGRDARMIAALKGEDRRVAEIPVEHHEPHHQAARLQRPAQFGNSTPSFFGWLFR